MPTSTGPRPRLLGVPITRFFDTLSTYMGSTFVNDFNILGTKPTGSTAQADNPFRLSLRDVGEICGTRSPARARWCRSARSQASRRITGPYRVPRL